MAGFLLTRAPLGHHPQCWAAAGLLECFLLTRAPLGHHPLVMPIAPLGRVLFLEFYDCMLDEMMVG